MRKMLKHDLASVWPVWRIMAPVALLSGIISGIALRVINSDIEWPEGLEWIIMLSGSLLTSLWPMMLTAFSIVTLILIVMRYYKNFFTDEGYLTFTLPVSRTKLLNSKIAMALIWMAATAVVCVLAYFAFIFISEFGMEGYDPGVDLEPVEDPLFGKYGMLIFLVELLAFAVITSVADILLLLLCVTLGAVIVKRAKLVLGLGLYYGLNATIGVLMYVFIIVAMVLFASVASEGDYESSMLAARWVLFGTPALGILLFGGLGIGSYFINLKLIKQKLNLP